MVLCNWLEEYTLKVFCLSSWLVCAVCVSFGDRSTSLILFNLSELCFLNRHCGSRRSRNVLGARGYLTWLLRSSDVCGWFSPRQGQTAGPATVISSSLAHSGPSRVRGPWCAARSPGESPGEATSLYPMGLVTPAGSASVTLWRSRTRGRRKCSENWKALLVRSVSWHLCLEGPPGKEMPTRGRGQMSGLGNRAAILCLGPWGGGSRDSAWGGGPRPAEPQEGVGREDVMLPEKEAAFCWRTS